MYTSDLPPSRTSGYKVNLALNEKWPFGRTRPVPKCTDATPACLPDEIPRGGAFRGAAIGVRSGWQVTARDDVLQ